MALKRIADSVQDSFYRWGWLIPAFLPLAQVAGRGVFNTLSAIYFLWAIASLRGVSGAIGDFRPYRWFFALYALMLLVWALSLTQAADIREGSYDLLRYLQYSLTGLFTLLVLLQGPGQLDRLVRALAWGAFLVIVVLYLQLPYYLFAVEFEPAFQLREDNLPWLLAFLLLGLSGLKHARWLAGAAVVAFAIYIGISQGRAALLGLLVALTVFAMLGFKVRKTTLVASALAILAMGIVLGERFFRDTSGLAFDFATLDRFSSGRVTIWWQALNAPPENIWLGVGLGNVASHTEVLRISSAETVKHLHNFLFDAWFETGLLGLGAMLVLFGATLTHGVRTWRRIEGAHRLIAAAAIAGIAALLAAGLLSFSYTSRQFALYLYLLFAILLALPAAARGASRS